MNGPARVSAESPTLLSLLGHPQRWRLLAELVRSDRRVHELAEAVAAAPNLISYHLRKLREHSIVQERRSSADARDVYYSLDLARLDRLYLEAVRDLHPGLAEGAGEERRQASDPTRHVRVLFLCTHNSARSQMAEGILRQIGGDRFEVESAGSEPSRVHPLAIEAMKKLGIDITGQRSKHMSELADRRFDHVVTVCDIASETCPVFPGAPQRIHWSIPDPSAAEGTRQERLVAFEAAATDLLTRIRYFITFVERKGSAP